MIHTCAVAVHTCDFGCWWRSQQLLLLRGCALRSPASDPRFTPETYGENAGKITELIALPICDFNGELKGVLELVNREGGQFRKADEDVLAHYCKLCGITLLNSFALKAAQRVQTDPATAAAARSGSLKASRRGSATSQSGAPPPLMVDTADRASNIDTLAPPSAPSGAPKERTKTYVA